MTTTTADKGELLPLPDGECCEWLQHGRRVNAFPHPKKPMSEQSDYERKYWVPKGYDAAPLFTADQMREYALANMNRRATTAQAKGAMTDDEITALAVEHENEPSDRLKHSVEFDHPSLIKFARAIEQRTDHATATAEIAKRDAEIARLVQAVADHMTVRGEYFAELTTLRAQLAEAQKARCPNLMPVITWLKNGCNVADAITELELYQYDRDAAMQSAQEKV